MSKAWSLRYALVRAQLGWEETLAHLTTSTASLPDAIAKGLEVYRKELTKVILFTGIDVTTRCELDKDCERRCEVLRLLIVVQSFQ